MQYYIAAQQSYADKDTLIITIKKDAFATLVCGLAESNEKQRKEMAQHLGVKIDNDHEVYRQARAIAVEYCKAPMPSKRDILLSQIKETEDKLLEMRKEVSTL